MSNRKYMALVVEDDVDSQQVIAQVLAYRGIACSIAVDGVECLQLLETLRPDLIIMDLSMPRLDGWRSLQLIRGHPVAADVPVIAVTAYDSETLSDAALQAGFDAYCRKPIDIGPFLEQLESLLAAHSAHAS